MKKNVIIAIILILFLIPWTAYGVLNVFYNTSWKGSSPLHRYAYMRYDSGAKFTMYDSSGNTLFQYDETLNTLILGTSTGTAVTLNASTGEVSLGIDGQTVDIPVNFLASNADGLYTWDESADQFLFSDDVILDTTERIYFRDADTSIFSDAAKGLTYGGTTHTFTPADADTDLSTVWTGTSASGSLDWMEDEDFFQLNDDAHIATGEQITLRDAAISIGSADDGRLDIAADTSIDLNSAVLGSSTITATTALAAGSTVATAEGSAWDLQDYTVGAPTADGFLVVVVDGSTYHIAVDLQ